MLAAGLGGEKETSITRPQAYRIASELLPRRHWTPEQLLEWLQETQERNEAAKRSHAKRRRRRDAQESPP